MLRLLRAAVALAAVLGPACAPPQVGLRLRFPSTETFLVATTARIEIYAAGDAPDAICRALSVGQPAGSTTLQSTGKQDVCAFADGLQLDPVATGRLVIFAEIDDAQGAQILRGCRVADVDGLKPASLAGADAAAAESLGVDSFVDVQLATLPSYPDDPAPACQSVDEKCVARVSCATPGA